LLEQDFLAEQDYHVNARLHHNLNLHDWGVVHGLTVSRSSDTSVTVHPGVAIDASGYEIHLRQTQRLSVAGFEPRERLQIGLGYEEGASTGEVGGTSPMRRIFHAVITVSRLSEGRIGLTLAQVQLDHNGHVDEQTIDYAETKYAKLVAPGSITPLELHESLRRGWLRVPFRPTPMVEGPEEGTEEGLPAFLVGATEARSPNPRSGERDRGAAGTMAIPIPPNVTSVTRMRIAGLENQGEITLKLFVGGWDRVKSEHVRKIILDETIPAGRAFFKEYDIINAALDPEYHTLALWLKGTRKTAVSLVAVEFAYYPGQCQHTGGPAMRWWSEAERAMTASTGRACTTHAGRGP
jgi:hypothetical protein